MKLGTEFPQAWKEKSQKEGMTLADILYGYAIEDIMQRIGKSSFHEYLWLANENALGKEAYCRKRKRRLEFFYIEKEKKFFHTETQAGDTFGKSILDLLEREIFPETVVSEKLALDKKDTDICWQSQIKRNETMAEISLVGTFLDMRVPVTLWIDATAVSNKKAKEKKRLFFIDEKKSFSYFSYTKESILAEDLFEIMRKLELLSDMGCYDRVNEILKTYAISGRYIIEDFKSMGQKEPKVVSMKRWQQLSAYKSYGYMKKKWQRYAKNYRKDYDDWETVMGRVEKFLGPIWKALCEDEIFLDDWMPELERFLG